MTTQIPPSSAMPKIRTPTSTVAAVAVPSVRDSEAGSCSHATTNPKQNGRPTNSAQPYEPRTVIDRAARTVPNTAVITTDLTTRSI
jgi:hypothetical protein